MFEQANLINDIIMNNENIKELKNKGFTGFLPFSEIWNDYSILPHISGIYLVLLPDEFELKFLPNKDKDYTLSSKILKNTWIKDARILYINTSDNLFIHIKLLLESRESKVSSLLSFRSLWRLNNNQDLLIAWKKISGVDLKKERKSLFTNFIDKYGKLPFVNIHDKLQLKDESQKDIISMISHNTSPLFNYLKSVMISLNDYISRKRLSEDYIEETVEQPIDEDIDFINEPEIDSSSETVSQALQRLSNYLDRIHKIVKQADKYVSLNFERSDFGLYEVYPFLNEFMEYKRKEYRNICKFILSGDADQMLGIFNKTAFIFMLDQLVQNSLSHAFNGNVNKNNIIEIIVKYNERGIVILYRDNGANFPLTEEEFFQKGVKGNKSNGLGLGGSFIKNVIVAHRGKINIKNRKQWTEFVIILPYPNIGGSK
jgi:signal transduction histidine kinase